VVFADTPGKGSAKMRKLFRLFAMVIMMILVLTATAWILVYELAKYFPLDK